MAVYQNRAREAAERLVKLRDYLYTNASPTHAVKAKDMLAYLESIGHKIKIKTLYSDLNILTAYFGLDLQYDGRQKGYILNNPQFEPYELRMIVNSIQAAKFITQEDADRLTAKITKLADEYTRPSLKRKTYIPNRVRAINKEAMEGLDTIYEAIAQDRKINYRYFRYTSDRDNPRKYAEIDGSKIITTSPFGVSWNGDRNGADAVCGLGCADDYPTLRRVGYVALYGDCTSLFVYVPPFQPHALTPPHSGCYQQLHDTMEIKRTKGE